MNFSLKEKILMAIGIILLAVPPHFFGALTLFFLALRKYSIYKKEQNTEHKKDELLQKESEECIERQYPDIYKEKNDPRYLNNSKNWR